MAQKRINPTIARLHRLQGQLSGVERLIKSQTKTTDIIQQLEAVRGSLKSLEKDILSKKSGNLKDKELQKTINYLLKIS